MKKLFSILLALIGFTATAQIPYSTEWKEVYVRVINNQHGAAKDTLPSHVLKTTAPNVKFITKASTDSVDLCLQTVVLPSPTKTCDFVIFNSAFTRKSADSVFVTSIGKVNFTSTSSARKILLSTSTTGAGKVYGVYGLTKGVTTFLAGYYIRLHYNAITPSTGEWTISDPIASR